MGQTWKDLAFLHWPVDPAALAAVLPPQIEPDVFDGSAWIGVTPFEVQSLRLRFTPPVAGLSTFPEINVRTYTTRNGGPGVWFLSLDAASRPAVAAARRAYRVPYHHARIAIRRRDGSIEYESRRVRGEADFAGRYRARGPVGQALPGSFEHFAAERYCLYTLDESRRVLRADIHHPPWRLQPAEAEIEVNTMARPYGFELDSPPRAHFAERQDVVFWTLEPDD
jgi:uncharacterized protein YqjF (DUF2071 family)